MTIYVRIYTNVTICLTLCYHYERCKIERITANSCMIFATKYIQYICRNCIRARYYYYLNRCYSSMCKISNDMYNKARRLLVCLYNNDVFIYRPKLTVYTVMVYATEHIIYRNSIGDRFLFRLLGVIQFNISNDMYQDQAITGLFI